MENYKMMVKTLKEYEPKLTAARGLAQRKGVKADVSVILNGMATFLSDMAQCLDNYICSMSTSYLFLMDANVTVFNLDKNLFDSSFNTLSSILDTKMIVKGGDNNEA